MESPSNRFPEPAKAAAYDEQYDHDHDWHPNLDGISTIVVVSFPSPRYRLPIAVAKWATTDHGEQTTYHNDGYHFG